MKLLDLSEAKKKVVIPPAVEKIFKDSEKHRKDVIERLKKMSIVGNIKEALWFVKDDPSVDNVYMVFLL